MPNRVGELCYNLVPVNTKSKADVLPAVNVIRRVPVDSSAIFILKHFL